MPFIPGVVPIAVRAGGAIGGAVFGKRKRSTCRSIDAADVDEFKAGRKVPHVLWERLDDIGLALIGKGGAATVEGAHVAWRFLGSSKPPNWEAAVGSPAVSRLAELHMHAFVPLCQEMEGDRLTEDPGSGEGLALYNSARARFQEQIKSGRILFHDDPAGSGPGDSPVTYGPGTGLDPGSILRSIPRTQPGRSPGEMRAPGAPLQAGGLVLAVGAVLLLLVFASRGQ